MANAPHAAAIEANLQDKGWTCQPEELPGNHWRVVCHAAHHEAGQSAEHAERRSASGAGPTKDDAYREVEEKIERGEFE